jgi:MFS family permease
VRRPASPALLFLHAVAGQFIFCLVLALPGTLFGMPPWTRAVDCDVAAQANLLAVFFLGQLFCTAVAGNLVDRFGPDRVIVGGTAGLAVGFLALAQATGQGSAAAGIALLAAGGSAINAGTNTLVSVTFGERRGPMLNLMGLFGALGAFITPFVMQAGMLPVVERLYILAGVSAVISVVPLAFADSPWTSTGVSLGAMLSLARDRALVAIIVLTAIEFGVEALMAGWSAAYALAVMPTVAGGAVVAAYWGGLAAGRALGPLVLKVRSKPTTVAIGAFLALAGSAIIASATSGTALLAGAAIAGIALGPMAPTLISVAGDRYPKRTGLAIGAVISLGQIGGVTLPWITGRTAIAVGFRGAMLVPMVASIAILAGAVTLRVRSGR